MHDLLSDYNKLRSLLGSQREAWTTGNTQKSTALLPLISRSTDSLIQSCNRVESLSEVEKAHLKSELTDLLSDVQLNQECLKQVFQHLEQARVELQSARRFSRQLASPSQPSKRQVHFKG